MARRAWLPAIVAAVTAMMLLATAIPAGAHLANNHGHGAGEWDFTSVGYSTAPPCGYFTSLDYEGTFEGNFTSSGKTYTGPVVVNYTEEAGQDWYANPNGTYSPTDPVKCGGTAGYEITLDNVNIASPLTGVACTQNSGTSSTFGRVAGVGTAKLQVNCTVTDDTGTSSLFTTTVTVISTSWACARLPTPGFPPNKCFTTDEYAF